MFPMPLVLKNYSRCFFKVYCVLESILSHIIIYSFMLTRMIRIKILTPLSDDKIEAQKARIASK